MIDELTPSDSPIGSLFSKGIVDIRVYVAEDGGTRLSVATPTSVAIIPVELPPAPTLSQLAECMVQAMRQCEQHAHMPAWHEEVLPWGRA